MRYALIIAGGSGTRLWPMSRANMPKQLLPFIGGKSLLQIAFERLAGVVPPSHCYVCAAEQHRQIILRALPELAPEQFLGEPCGRDTLNAVGLGTAVIAEKDPEAVVAVFTADHIIEPVARFQQIIERGYALAETHQNTLVTFGIAPTAAATGYGYLELGDSLDGDARIVRQFREKPDASTAQNYFSAGASRYLWNSGMFVWQAATFLGCLERYKPSSCLVLRHLASNWGEAGCGLQMAAAYPGLEKISVDFAIMEPASCDPAVRVAALPMALDWLDVGSWPMFAKTCPHDEQGNALSADEHLLLKTSNTLVASSDPNHVIAACGCEDLVIIHTPDVTLVCRADQAENIKELHRMAGERWGKALL